MTPIPIAPRPASTGSSSSIAPGLGLQRLHVHGFTAAIQRGSPHLGLRQPLNPWARNYVHSARETLHGRTWSMAGVCLSSWPGVPNIGDSPAGSAGAALREGMELGRWSGTARMYAGRRPDVDASAAIAGLKKVFMGLPLA